MMTKTSVKFVCCLVLVIGIVQCATTQLSFSAFHLAPVLSNHVFFLTYAGIFVNLLFLPMDAVVRKMRGPDESVSSSSSSGSGGSISSATSLDPLVPHKEESAGVQGASAAVEPQPVEEERSIPQKIGVLVLLYSLYIAANFCYVYAISIGMHASIVSAIFASCPAFVVLFSWIIVKLQPTLWQYLGVLCGTAGVVLALEPWRGSSDFSGSANEQAAKIKRALVCAALSPVFAALYKVVFSRLFQNSDWNVPAKILGELAGVNLILGTALIFGVIFPFGVEAPFWAESTSRSSNSTGAADSGPFALNTTTTTTNSLATVSSEAWLVQVASSLTGLLFNFLVNWGVTLVPPVYVSIGTVLSTAFSSLVDFSIRKLPLSGWVQACGFVMIMASFVSIAWAAHQQQQQEELRESVVVVEAEEGDQSRYGAVAVAEC